MNVFMIVQPDDKVLLHYHSSAPNHKCGEILRMEQVINTRFGHSKKCLKFLRVDNIRQIFQRTTIDGFHLLQQKAAKEKAGCVSEMTRGCIASAGFIYL